MSREGGAGDELFTADVGGAQRETLEGKIDDDERAHLRRPESVLRSFTGTLLLSAQTSTDSTAGERAERRGARRTRDERRRMKRVYDQQVPPSPPPHSALRYLIPTNTRPKPAPSPPDVAPQTNCALPPPPPLSRCPRVPRLGPPNLLLPSISALPYTSTPAWSAVTAADKVATEGACTNRGALG